MSTAAAAVLPLEVRGLYKSFGPKSAPVPVLRGVDLALSPGEMVAVMGPSGSGKSTLLHVIAGLTQADAGSVRVEGQDVARLSDARLTALRRRRVGLVFQAYNLIPTLTVRDNIALPVRADGRREDEDELRRLTGRLGIGDKLGRFPGQLSGGEQQRVAVARALLPNPAVVLADEPTGNLDTAGGEALCRQLKELNENEGRTLLVVTHEPGVAMWAHRVVVLKDGRLVGEIPGGSMGSSHALALRYQEILEGAGEA